MSTIFKPNSVPGYEPYWGEPTSHMKFVQECARIPCSLLLIAQFLANGVIASARMYVTLNSSCNEVLSS